MHFVGGGGAMRGVNLFGRALWLLIWWLWECMLDDDGELYELIRENAGFRALVEKLWIQPVVTGLFHTLKSSLEFIWYYIEIII